MTLTQLKGITQELLPSRERTTWSPIATDNNNTPDLAVAEIKNCGLNLEAEMGSFETNTPYITTM